MTQSDQRKEYMRKYRLANAERIKEQKKRYNSTAERKLRRNELSKAQHLKYRYGLIESDYQELVAKGCEICGSFLNLVVDHDHSTGEVRGCLCQRCNISVGHLETNILPNLDKFTQYLGGT